MNNTVLIVLLGFYTLLLVGGIHHYESKIKDMQETIYDYQRALNLAKNRPDAAEHYTWLQLQNNQQKDLIKELDLENSMLQNQVKSLKERLAGGTDIQYESSTYQPKTWSSNYETLIEL